MLVLIRFVPLFAALYIIGFDTVRVGRAGHHIDPELVWALIPVFLLLVLVVAIRPTVEAWRFSAVWWSMQAILLFANVVEAARATTAQGFWLRFGVTLALQLIMALIEPLIEPLHNKLRQLLGTGPKEPSTK